MSFKMQNLNAALNQLGHLSGRTLMFFVWADTDKECKPIVRPVKITFHPKMSDKAARGIILGINNASWIIIIIDEHKNVYRLTDVEVFAKKKCKPIVLSEVLSQKPKAKKKKQQTKKKKRVKA